MQIFINRNNQKFGPYTLDHIHTYLTSGQIQLSDLAWYEGIQDWVPLAQVPGVQGLQLQVAPPPPPSIIPHVQQQQGHGRGAMICPHCHAQGHIRTKHIKQKKGISGGKATAAVLTGGLSLLAVGLSRKEKATQAHCGNCGNSWVF